MKKSSFLLYALLALGAALIWFIFSLFAGKSGAVTSSEWLLLAVLYLNYILFFFDIPLLFGKRGSFSRRIPVLGISLYAQSTYAVLSLGLAIAGAAARLRFEYLAAGQGLLLFALLANGLVASIGSEKVGEVEESEREALGSVRPFKDAMGELLIVVRGKPFCADMVAPLEGLSERLRFVSPVDSDQARELDRSIAEAVDGLRLIVAAAPDEASYKLSKPDLQRALSDLSSLAERRKAMRN